MLEGLKFLPPQLLKILSALHGDKLCEIRIRANQPIKVFYDREFFYLQTQDNCLNANFLSKTVPKNPVTVGTAQISEMILRAAQFSIYAVNNQISDGFLTVSGGIRIGIAGDIVYENDRVKTQKNFSSLVIRIPHEVKNSALIACKYLLESPKKNMLIISPPGCGKTTILRDLTRRISDSGSNVLLVDERGEIANCLNGEAGLDVGINTDIISNTKKEYAFNFGIRSLRPDYIVTDELASQADILAVKKAALSGVNVIASIHALGIEDIKNKEELKELILNKIFNRFVVISLRKGMGTYEEILDEDLHAIFTNAN